MTGGQPPSSVRPRDQASRADSPGRVGVGARERERAGRVCAVLPCLVGAGGRGRDPFCPGRQGLSSTTRRSSPFLAAGPATDRNSSSRVTPTRVTAALRRRHPVGPGPAHALPSDEQPSTPLLHLAPPPTMPSTTPAHRPRVLLTKCVCQSRTRPLSACLLLNADAPLPTDLDLSPAASDDGPPSAHESPMIFSFAQALRAVNGWDVTVVVPSSQKSWIGGAYVINGQPARELVSPFARLGCASSLRRADVPA